MFKTILLVALVATLATAQFGKCPQFKVQDNFDAKRYFGLWYEQARLNTPWETDGVCTTAQYSLNTTNSRVIVNNTERVKTPQGEIKGAVGEAYAPNPQEPAKLLVKFPNVPLSIAAPYWVLSTDYDNYATIVTCIEIASVYHSIASWIIARKPALNSTILNEQLTMLKGYGVAVDKFTPTLQQGCW